MLIASLSSLRWLAGRYGLHVNRTGLSVGLGALEIRERLGRKSGWIQDARLSTVSNERMGHAKDRRTLSLVLPRLWGTAAVQGQGRITGITEMREVQRSVVHDC